MFGSRTKFYKVKLYQHTLVNSIFLNIACCYATELNEVPYVGKCDSKGRIKVSKLDGWYSTKNKAVSVYIKEKKLRIKELTNLDNIDSETTSELNNQLYLLELAKELKEKLKEKQKSFPSRFVDYCDSIKDRIEKFFGG